MGSPCEMTWWEAGPFTELAEEQTGRREMKGRAFVIPL